MEYSTTIDALHQVTQSNAFENLAPPLQIAVFLGSLAFITTLLVSVTSFTRIVIVLSFVRRAMTTQEIPPNASLMGLALFLTVFTMGPTFDAIYEKAVAPYATQSISGVEAVQHGAAELHRFMVSQTREDDIILFLRMADVVESLEVPEDVPFRILVPAYMISELKTAFIMGFCIYIPFVLVDLLISTILMSLGMMMMPPVVVSAPIKLLLFVLVDGWNLVAQGLGTSFL